VVIGQRQPDPRIIHEDINRPNLADSPRNVAIVT
jgi:hypothetical protein